jgi:Cytochrome P460
MRLRAAVRAIGALAVFAAIGAYALYVTKSAAQNAKEGQPPAESNASPIYGVTIPAGYRDWRLIAVKQLTGKTLKQLRAQLGNDIAITAFRDGKLPFPDGAIIAALHWNEASSDLDNQVLATGFPDAGLASVFAGSPVNVQFMVKDQKSTPRPAAGATPTSPTANPAIRRCTKNAFPATCLQKIAITFSRATHRRLESKRASSCLDAMRATKSGGTT